MKRKALYPGIMEARRETENAARKAARDAFPDIVQTASGIAPNYDAFPGWSADRVLTWCNMD